MNDIHLLSVAEFFGLLHMSYGFLYCSVFMPGHEDRNAMVMMQRRAADREEDCEASLVLQDNAGGSSISSRMQTK